MFHGFDETLAALERMEARLSTPRDFWLGKAAEYHGIARRIAVDVLTHLRPPDQPADTWAAKVDRVADRVTADVSIWGNSLVLGIQDPGEANPGVPVQRLPPGSAQVVTLDDIREWIRAGLRGEEGGKRITPGDESLIRDRGIDAVAQRVRTAYYSRAPLGAYGRLRSAIQRYFLGAKDKDTDPLLDAVATAWTETFTPIVQRDLEKWVGERCGEV